MQEEEEKGWLERGREEREKGRGETYGVHVWRRATHMRI